MSIAPWYADAKATLLLGDAAAVLAQMPADSVDCVVTSPPYYATRDWGDGQIGQEPTPAAYLDALRAVFREVHRVLKDDGTCWLNLADVYAAGPAERRTAAHGEPPVPVKSLLGLPWRLMLALQRDHWRIRNEAVWVKPNAIPESCRDRLARRHELVYLLTKSPRYHFDLDAIRQPSTGERALSRRAHRSANKPNTARGAWPPVPSCSAALGPNVQLTGRQQATAHAGGRNPGTVWTIPTRPTRHAHTAAFPPDLALRCIEAGCPPGGVTLDPFSGSGTTIEAALRLGRRAVGIDLREDFHCLALARLRVARGDA
jgi:site-specific DNA-methyltransferase (cytosine-N4-specific)